MIKTNDDLRPHSIVLGSGAVVSICMGFEIASKYAAKSYLEGTYTVRPSTPEDVAFVCTEGGINRIELIEKAMSTKS